MSKEHGQFSYSPTLAKALPPSSAKPAMKRGRVKSWGPEQGFGYIIQDDGGPNLWFHASVILSAAAITERNLVKDQFVEYEVGVSRKGPLATSVRALRPDEIDTAASPE